MPTRRANSDSGSRGSACRARSNWRLVGSETVLLDLLPEAFISFMSKHPLANYLHDGMYPRAFSCKPIRMPAAIPSWYRIVACAALIMTLSMGVRQVSGLFLGPVVFELGLSREAFGIAVALQNLVWGLTQPIAGLIADRYGARPVVIAGAVLYAAGMALAATAHDSLTFTLGLGVLCGLGQSGTAFAVVLAVIGRAAPGESRSAALGIGSAAGSVGMFVLVPATGALIELVAWRNAMMLLAALLALMPLLGLALGRERAGA